MGLFSNTVMIRPGMTYEELKNALEQKEYKSEKQKARVQERVISAFATADKDNDNVISKNEYIKDGIKQGLSMGLSAVAIGGAVFLGLKGLQAKRLAKIVTPAIKELNWKEIADDACKKAASELNKMT